MPSSLPDHIRQAVVQAMNTSTANTSQQHQVQGRRTSGWAIEPAEKSKYDSIFKTWDPTNTGYIDGDRARNIFSQSGLGDNVLAHIWGLADRDRHGKLNGDEFAVAMCLLYRYLIVEFIQGNWLEVIYHRSFLRNSYHLVRGVLPVWRVR